PSFAHHLRRPPFFCFFFSLPLPPPISTLFPYTTLFRSATRTCSRAVTLAIPHCQESQCDVDPIPAYSPQASRASNSPSTTRNRPVRAAIPAASAPSSPASSATDRDSKSGSRPPPAVISVFSVPLVITSTTFIA